MLNRDTGFAVHCLDESGVGFILIIRDKPPPDFLLARRVKKDIECVVAIPEKARSATSHVNGFALPCDLVTQLSASWRPYEQDPHTGNGRTGHFVRSSRGRRPGQHGRTVRQSV